VKKKLAETDEKVYIITIRLWKNLEACFSGHRRRAFAYCPESGGCVMPPHSNYMHREAYALWITMLPYYN
jgi:hypothetical protein